MKIDARHYADALIEMNKKVSRREISSKDQHVTLSYPIDERILIGSTNTLPAAPGFFYDVHEKVVIEDRDGDNGINKNHLQLIFRGKDVTGRVVDDGGKVYVAKKDGKGGYEWELFTKDFHITSPTLLRLGSKDGYPISVVPRDENTLVVFNPHSY